MSIERLNKIDRARADDHPHSFYSLEMLGKIKTATAKIPPITAGMERQFYDAQKRIVRREIVEKKLELFVKAHNLEVCDDVSCGGLVRKFNVRFRGGRFGPISYSSPFDALDAFAKKNHIPVWDGWEEDRELFRKFF